MHRGTSTLAITHRDIGTHLDTYPEVADNEEKAPSL
jgi:hypothetical protein